MTTVSTTEYGIESEWNTEEKGKHSHSIKHLTQQNKMLTLHCWRELFSIITTLSEVRNDRKSLHGSSIISNFTED